MILNNFFIFKQLNIKIPELKVFNVVPNLNTPTVMASLAKNRKISSNNLGNSVLNVKKETNLN